MSDLSKIFLYRMTHVENISHILKFGITHVASENANPAFVPIGDASLIERRSSFALQNGRKLGDYIPFYFGCKMPMLYVIQHGYNLVRPTPAESIVYCVSSVQKVIEQDLKFVFTDGHAVDSFSAQFTENDVESLESIIDMQAVNAAYWKNDDDLDLKRRKEAEFLLRGDLSPDAILGYIVYSQVVKNRVVELGADENRVFVAPDRYFKI